MNKAQAAARKPRSDEENARYLETHYPRQLPLATTPEARRAACAVGREAERVRAIRLALGSPYEN